MKAGNATYLAATDIPDVVPVFPLAGALLLPGGQLPLNIFEPRYLAMVDHAVRTDRLIGMVQPALRQDATDTAAVEEPELCEVGCLGRITAHQETGDGRLMIGLSGVCRYRIVEETDGKDGYRRAKISPFVKELQSEDDGANVDRDALLDTFRNYLDANGMEADWESITETDNDTLVTALCMMSPYGPAEKQALLEAPDLKSRAETLIAITEIELAKASNEAGSRLQ